MHLSSKYLYLYGIMAFSVISVWNVQTKKLHEELPGHADEVFAVDWAPDGSRVASGGKDRVLKL